MGKAKVLLAVLFFFTAALWLLLLLANRALAASAAPAITSCCQFTPSSNPGTFQYATDGELSTKWSSAKTDSRYIDFTVAPDHQIGGIYFVWSSPPSSWELLAWAGGDPVSILQGGGEGYLTQFVFVPDQYAGVHQFRLVMTPPAPSSAVDLAELSVFGPGDPPYYAPMWQPFPGRADLLTIVAHPDDEDLYMGVPAPTYANQGMRCVTVFMTYGSASASVRRFEAQESAWSLGNRFYPAMGNFRDVKTTTMSAALEYWPLDQTVGFIVEQIRKYRPSVIVTHDADGEYVHGAHILTEYATTLAFGYAGDPNQYPDSAARYGTWNAGKLYVHLYNRNMLNTMSLTDPLDFFGGRTVLQVIEDAYCRHKSQLPGRSLPTSGSYDMRKFGLYDTRLGPDNARVSMFENVSLDAMLALNPWYNYEVVDREGLRRALDAARAKNQADYTPESWQQADLPGVIAQAQTVMDTRESTQAQVNGQTEALQAAMAGLVAYITGLEITRLADRLAYLVGESLDLRGLVVTALCSDQSRRTVPVGGENVTGFDSSAPAARQELTVTYADAYTQNTVLFYVDILPVDGEKIATAAYAVDRDNWILSDVTAGTTVEALMANLSNDPANLAVYDRDGGPCSQCAAATGMTVKLTVDGVITDELRISVFGDVSGDGIIDINDILYIRADIIDTYVLSPCQCPASDISRDGAVDIDDILYIRAHILGTYAVVAK